MLSKDLDREEIMPLQHKVLDPKIIFEPSLLILKIKVQLEEILFQQMAPRMLVEVLEAS